MDLIQTILPSLLDGLKMTLTLFFIIGLSSIPLGFLVAVIRVYGPKWLGFLIQIYVFIMRGTPLLLQLMFVFFGLPLIGITLDRFTAAILAYIINYAAYYAEIFRGGITAVPKGQFEAISVLGIGKVRGFFKIIIPQVTKIASWERIGKIVQLSALGVPLRATFHPPPEIPGQPRTVYFILDTSDQLWQELVADRKIAFFLRAPYDPQRARVRLVAIPRKEP